MRYVIDANILINAHQMNYPFDIFPTLWDLLKQNIISGNVVIIDKIKDEINKGNDGDALKIWFNQCNFSVASTSVISVVNALGQVSNLVMNMLKQNKYKGLQTVNQFLSVADPYLIAYCMAYNCELITYETRTDSFNSGAHSRVKIPDIADQFNVPCISLVEFLRRIKASI